MVHELIHPRGIEGHCVFLKGDKTSALLSWNSRRIRKVTTSTAAAEMYAIQSGVEAALKVKGLLETCLGRTVPMTVMTDSEAARMAIVKGHSKRMSATLRHEGLSIAWLQQTIGQDIHRVRSQDNPADILTKACPHTLHTDLSTRLGIRT